MQWSCLFLLIGISCGTSADANSPIDQLTATVIQRYMICRDRPTINGAREALRLDERTRKWKFDGNVLGRYVRRNRNPESDLQKLKRFLDDNLPAVLSGKSTAMLVHEAANYCSANRLVEISSIPALVVSWVYTAPARNLDRERSSLPHVFTDEHRRYLKTLFENGRYSQRKMLVKLEEDSKANQLPPCSVNSARMYLVELNQQRTANIEANPQFSDEIIAGITDLVERGWTKQEVMTRIYPEASKFVTIAALETAIREIMATHPM